MRQAGSAEASTEVEIIRLLRETHEGFTSGQTLSARLGISRAAVWKHIEILRKAGYTIDASPSKGYRLSEGKAPFNGVEISAGLTTEFVGKRLHFFDSVESTNKKAFELGRAGEPDGTAVVADAQSGGRGRLGRFWVSPPGVNLYTSIILRPDIEPLRAHELTFVAAVATAEAVRGFVPRGPAVKWPNDLLMDSRKVAGILLEMDSEVDRVNFVVVGIGINVNMKSTVFPAELRGKATSIMEKTGFEVKRTEVLRALYSSVEVWYKEYMKEGFAPVLNAWRSFFPSEGKRVKVKAFDREIEGICLGVDQGGALLVRTPSGGVERVVSGDMEPGRE